MNKRGSWMLWVSVAFAIILILVLFLYFALFHTDNSRASGVVPKNPVIGLTDEEAIRNFNASYVYYLLYSIKAYNLHNVPLTGDYPRMNVNVDGQIFGATVRNGIIDVGNEEVMNEDVVITSTKVELINIMRNSAYAADSFGSGKSSIGFVASKTILFAKGYLNMYNSINGKSITGNIIRISTE